MEAEYIESYVNLVESGKICACNEIKLAIKRVKRYLEEYKYKHNEVEKRIRFIENECSNTKGNNSKLRLALPQKFWLSVAWGFYHDVNVLKTDPNTMEQYVEKEERRLINEIPLIVSRASGKTTLASAIGMVGLIADNEYGSDVSCLAMTREQAGLLFNASRAMTSNEDTLLNLMKRANVLKSTKQGLLYTTTNSLMSIKTSEYDVLDGLNSHMVVFDEVHAYTEDFIGVVKDGSSRKRKNWQVWYISTNGTTRGMVFDTYLNIWKDVLEEKIKNDSIFPFIYKLDSMQEVNKLDKWVKAVPLLGITTSREAIEKDKEMAKNNPALQAELLAKTFNLPINNYLAYFTNEECQGNKKQFKEEKFVGTDELNVKCILGIDLSDVRDICSISFMVVEGEKRYFYNKKYLPRKTVESLPKEQKDKYLEWEAKGYLHIHEKDFNDQEYIFNDLREYMREHKIFPICVGYDRWCAKQIKGLFDDYYGDITVDIPQTVKVLSNPLKIYKEKLKGGNIIFNDPVSTWNHSNVMVKVDANNNIFPNKAQAKSKIDVFASQLDAFIAYEIKKDELWFYYS